MKEEDVGAFSVEETGVSITTRFKDEKEYVHFYPASIPTEMIVQDSTAASGIEMARDQELQMVEAVDIAKANKPYFSEFEVSLSWTDGLKIKVKREPRKIVRWYRK